MKIKFYRIVPLCVWLVGVPIFAAFPVGDLDHNFIVDLDDVVLFAQQWLQTPDCFGAPGCGDLEGNDGVNVEDFALVAQHWQQRGEITLVINELMASNDSTLEDPDEPGEYPDWIEIFNYGNEAIPLSGMVLEDSANTYLIPSGVTIAAGQYLVFYADEDPGQGPLHTNFKLGAGGDEVTLFSYDGQTLIDSVSFSDQSEDISYGRYPDATEDWYTMDSPSPGLTNNMGMAGEVYFSRLSGTFSSNFSLTLSALSPTADIYYTTDGSIPTESSNEYSGPFMIDNTQARQIRARAYQSALAPGPVTSHYYIPIASDIQNFSSNLPIIIIDSFGTNIDENGGSGCWDINYLYQPVASVFFDLDKDSGLASTSDIPDFAGRAGSRIRGESSRCWPKRHYSLELWDEYNRDIKASLLGLPSESDWILNNPYGDKTLMRNVLAYKWANSIGQGFAAPETKFVEVFYNQDGGNCSYSDYRGIYVLTEKIKVSENRLDIGNLGPSDNTEPEITGGYILRLDKDYNNEYEEFNTSANMVTNSEGQGFQYYDPDQFTLTAAQKSWILSHFNEYESVLNSSSFNDPVNGYAKYIDVESFIESDIIAELFKEADGFKYSTYLYKEKNGKIGFGPQWDFNFSSGNATNADWWYPVWLAKAVTNDEGWYNDGCPSYGWHNRLLQDGDYKLRTADKWFEHREDKLSDSQVTTDIDHYYTLLDSDGPLVNTGSTPADRNFAKWNILNTYQWCNYYHGYNSGRVEQGNLPHTYKMETEWLKNWFNGQGTPAAGEWYLATHSDRLGNLDAFWQSDRNIAAPPTLLVDGVPMDTGGTVSPGAVLTMTSAAPGTLYYTTDGTDPREWTHWDTGGVAPFATMLLTESTSKKALVPTVQLSDNWKGGGSFDDSAWTSVSGGVGYERSSGHEYDPQISCDVESLMYNIQRSCYVRAPFTVDAGDLADMDYMKLWIRFDDAFVAYINGTEVCRSANVPGGTPLWNDGATGYPEDSTGLVEFDISDYKNELNSGSGNVIAIHGLNYGVGSSDFLISFELEIGTAGTGGGGLVTGGGVSPTAMIYTGGMTLNDSTRIRARVKNGPDWGALNEAYFSDSRVADYLRVTEIMYHPADPNHEFIEVQNVGPSAVNLAWVRFTDGIDFTFSDMTLSSGQYAVVVRNQDLFESLYGTGITIAGQFSGALSNGGEEIVLRDAFGTEILDFDYDDNWYPVTDGAGFSLNIINPSDPDPNRWDQKESWQGSSIVNGTPGSANPANVTPNGAIVINETLTHSNSYPNDWIELHNTTGSAINIGGWFLSDDRDNLKKYQIAAGQSIPPYGYKVFTQDDNFGNSASDPGRLVGFGLSELGEEVYLSSGSGGNLSGGYSVWEEFGASQWDVSFGRHEKSDGSIDFVSMQSMSKGFAEPNDPLIGDVVITEIMYNPSVVQDQLGEYIEMKNRTGETVNLYDPSNPANTWKFTKGIDFTFPTGVSIAPGNRILVVRTDPDIFRVVYPGIPAGVAIYGPYVNSELANDGEKIELSRPGDPEPGGFVPYIRVEQVNYSDGSHPLVGDPWPTGADGRGGSLHRTTASEYANDVANWTAATPTPGT